MAGLAPDCESGCLPLPAQPTPAASLDDGAEAADAPPAPAATAPPGEMLYDGEPASEPPMESEPASDTAPPADAEAIEQPAADLSTLRVLNQNVLVANYDQPLPADDATGATAATDATGAVDASAAGEAVAPMALQWPAPPCATNAAAIATAPQKPACFPYNGPVLSHTKIYHGDDAYVSQALEGYASFRDDHRLAGWKSYLSRSDDYVRFCCHMHICEMLSARGGARETGVVFRWPDNR
jgi:hypothetical protein